MCPQKHKKQVLQGAEQIRNRMQVFARLKMGMNYFNITKCEIEISIKRGAT